MRAPVLLLAAVLCAAPALAQASVRLHLPHKNHHRGRAEPASGPAAPTSDIPDPVWATGQTRR